MLDNILHDQATVLRSLADELESVADALQRERNAQIVMPAPEPATSTSPVSEEQTSPPQVNVIYNCDLEPDSRINLSATIHMARRDAKSGKLVKLDYGGRGVIYLDQTNWNQEIIL